MKRQTTGKILVIAGIVLMAGALLLTAYNRFDAWMSGLDAAYIEELLRADIEKQRAELEEARQAAAITDVSAVSIEESDAEETSEMPVITIAGYDCIGILAIEDYDLTLPVISDWDYEHLQKAPCRYAGSYYSGDLVICGHNYSTHFGKLKQIPVGARISLLASDGAMYTYEVSNVEQVGPTEIDKMINNEDGDWDLTLFTCTTGGRARCAIRCILTEMADNGDNAGEEE